MTYSFYDLQKLRDLPIEGVAERLGLRVTRHKSLCPFHDDHSPSLSYNVRKNTFRCFVCDAHGGTIDLAIRLLSSGRSGGGSFKEACKWLADGSNVILQDNTSLSPSWESERGRSSFDASRYEGFFLRPWLSEEARKFLFDERLLDPRVISWCRVSSWRDRNGVNWLQTPYYDVDGKLIGVQNRNLDPSKSPEGDLPGGPRFKFPYGSRCSIYNLPVLKMLRHGEELWITEGCSDCWAMLSAGHKAIAIPSATLLKKKDIEPLRQVCAPPSAGGLGGSLHMYPDKDAPGERLFLQLKEILPDLQHHHLPVGCKDFSDYYVQLKSQSNNELQ